MKLPSRSWVMCSQHRLCYPMWYNSVSHSRPSHHEAFTFERTSDNSIPKKFSTLLTSWRFQIYYSNTRRSGMCNISFTVAGTSLCIIKEGFCVVFSNVIITLPWYPAFKFPSEHVKTIKTLKYLQRKSKALHRLQKIPSSIPLQIVEQGSHQVLFVLCFTLRRVEAIYQNHKIWLHLDNWHGTCPSEIHFCNRKKYCSESIHIHWHETSWYHIIYCRVSYLCINSDLVDYSAPHQTFDLMRGAVRQPGLLALALFSSVSIRKANGFRK